MTALSSPLNPSQEFIEQPGGFMTYPGYPNNYYSEEMHHEKQLEFANFRGRGIARSAANFDPTRLNFRSEHPQSPSNRSSSDQ